MKEDKFLSALNFIDDSFITETEEYKGEITMKKETTEFKKNTGFLSRYLRPVLAVAAAFAFIIGGCLMAPASQAGAFGIVVVSAAEPEKAEYAVADNTTVQLPVKAMLKVADIRNMDGETAVALQDKMTEEMENHLNFDDKSLNHYGYRCHRAENAVIYYGYTNSFMLSGIDTGRLEKLCISLDGLGVLEINNMSYGDELNEYGKEFAISAEEYRNVYASREGEGNFSIGWMFSDELAEMFNRNPDMPLSSISDTITFTALYNDGTSESFEITVSFDDSGVMSAVYTK